MYVYIYIYICKYVYIHICMPNMDGPPATKAIRALGYTAPIFGKMNAYLDMMSYVCMFIYIYIYIYICIYTYMYA
jgi:hypothetical protein